MVVAVLSLQGAVIEHIQMLDKLGIETFEIRKKSDLDKHFDGLIIPGGESTVQGKLLHELDIYDTLKEHNDMVTYNDNSKISLCNKYSLETHLNRLLSKKVWLKSGAYLIIEPTEALTVIDVNTGKADLKTNKESTFKKINLEAAKEIALQMKLRNISGIIIVDFINMSNNKDYDILTHEMSEYLTNDFSISNVVDITKLGLMELTRKKKEKSLEEIVNEKKDDN